MSELNDKLLEIKRQKDEYILPENLREGVGVFGVYGIMQEGVDTSDANATATDIVYDKTAYVNGEKLYGELYPVQEDYITSSEVVVDSEYDNTVGIVFDNQRDASGENYLIAPDGRLTVKTDCSTMANEIGLTPEILKSGEVVLGVSGTLQSGTSVKNSLISFFGEENIIDNEDEEYPDSWSLAIYNTEKTYSILNNQDATVTNVKINNNWSSTNNNKCLLVSNKTNVNEYFKNARGILHSADGTHCIYMFPDSSTNKYKFYLNGDIPLAYTKTNNYSNVSYQCVGDKAYITEINNTNFTVDYDELDLITGNADTHTINISNINMILSVYLFNFNNRQYVAVATRTTDNKLGIKIYEYGQAMVEVYTNLITTTNSMTNLKENKIGVFVNQNNIYVCVNLKDKSNSKYYYYIDQLNVSFTKVNSVSFTEQTRDLYMYNSPYHTYYARELNNCVIFDNKFVWDKNNNSWRAPTGAELDLANELCNNIPTLLYDYKNSASQSDGYNHTMYNLTTETIYQLYYNYDNVFFIYPFDYSGHDRIEKTYLYGPDILSVLPNGGYLITSYEGKFLGELHRIDDYTGTNMLLVPCAGSRDYEYDQSTGEYVEVQKLLPLYIANE